MADDEDDSWAKARERAQRRREAQAPRTRAMKDALAVVEPLKGEDPKIIRAALAREIADRGITDATDEELDFLTQRLRSPRRAAGALIFRQLKALGAAVGLLRDIARIAQPRWTLTPDDVPSLVTWRADQQAVEIVLRASDFPAAHQTLTRLFAELPHHEADEIGPDEVRPFGCWLSHERSGAASGPVHIHIGTFTIGCLPEADADLARPLIDEHGGDKQAIDIVADAYGQDVDTGRLHLFLPDRP